MGGGTIPRRNSGLIRLRRARAWRAVAGVAAAAVMVPALVAAAPAPGSHRAWSPFRLPAPRSVPGHRLPAGAGAAQRARLARWLRAREPGVAATRSTRLSAVWPAPSTGTARVGGSGKVRGRGARRPGQLAPAGRLPVAIGAAHGPAAAGLVRVGIAAHAAAVRAGVNGVIMTAQPAAGLVAGERLRVQVSYRGFAGEFGGAWAQRLRLVELPVCALTTPGLAACRDERMLPGGNDAAAQTVSAVVTVPTAAGAGAGAGTGTGGGTGTAQARPGPVVLAIKAGPSGPQGDYTATPLKPSGTWAVQQGDFTYSYPITVPPSLGGSAPDVTLAYDAQSVDSETAGSNTQDGAIGEGWGYSPGSIERSYQPCNQDGFNINSGDLCWAGDNAVLSLNGTSMPLVEDSSGNWHLQDDDGSQVQLLTGASNGLWKGQYWVLTTTDGTKYYFGLNHLPGDGSSGPDTDSAWGVPVYCPKSADPCNSSTEVTMGWQWNLDFVVDPAGNLTMYDYNAETNYYEMGGGQNQGKGTLTQYDRGGTLASISYGWLLSDAIAGDKAAAQVIFGDSQRCTNSDTSTCNSNKNSTYWPEVPWDQNCGANATNCTNYAPTFWSTQRMTSITTQVLDGSSYQQVDSYALAQSYPHGGGSNPVMYLDSITHTGADGTAVSLPPVSFDPPVEMENLVPGQSSQGEAPVYRPRIETITTETGEQIAVLYKGQECTDSSGNFPTPDSNTKPCYPVYWIPVGLTSPVFDWYYKTLVSQVSVNDVTGADNTGQGGQSSLVTSYNYLGGAAWHQNLAPVVGKGSRTWDQYRGYAQVEVMTGTSPDPVTDTLTTYMRGMNGDATASGGTKSVKVSDTLGDSYTDDNWLAGQVLETDTNTAEGGSTDQKAVNGPWSYDQTANQSEPGTAPNLTAHMLEQSQARTLTLTAAGSWRTVATNTYYNSNAQVTAVDQNPDGSPETCTSTSYATPPSGDPMMESYSDQVTEVTGAASGGACPAASSSNIVSDTRTYYDHPGTDLSNLGTLGSLSSPGGMVTGTAAAVTWPSSGSETWQPQSASKLDEYGRATSATNARGNTTTTAYTPATGALPTQTVATNPLGWTTTTTLDPGRQLPLTITDPNGEVTTETYDGLGRLTSVTLPIDQGQGAGPTYQYSYDITGTSPPAVTTQRLLEDGNYSSDVQIYDGMLQLRQEQQTPANGATGALITDTYHDSHGWVTKTSSPYYESADNPSTTLYSAQDSSVPAQTVSVYDGQGRVTASQFYSLGQLQWQTTTAYPGMDETDVTPPNGGTATSTFTNALGQTTAVYHYVKTTTPDGKASDADVTAYTYTPAGQQATVTDNAGNTWTYGYNLLGQKTSAADPDTGTTTYTYDPDGNVATTTDADGTELLYKYDALDRKTAEYSGSATAANELAAWTYDTLEKGQLTSSTAYVGGQSGDAYTQAITGYDASYQPTGTSTTIPASQGALAGTYTTSSQYSSLTGELLNTSYSGDGGLPAEKVGYGYDLEGLLSSVGGDSTPYLDEDTYSPQGQILRTQSGVYGKQLVQTYNYDPATTWLLSATTNLQTLSAAANTATYTYNQAGNITSEADGPGASVTQLQCFNYNDLQQLTTAWTDTGKTSVTPAPSVGGIGGCVDTKPTASTVGGAAAYWQSYGYDLLGDRTSEVNHDTTGNSANNVTQTLSYPGGGTAPATQPDIPTGITTTGPNGTTTTGVSANGDGQTTAQTDSTTGTSPPPGPPTASAITYTPQGQVASVNAPGSGKSTYLYDAGGNLLIQHDPSSTTLYLDGGAEELTLSSGTVTGLRFYDLPGELTMVRSSSGTLDYEATDQQHTASIAVDASSLNQTQRYFDPFGNPVGLAPTFWPDNLGFVGKPADGSTGLDLLGARQYDPVTGAFLSADPVFEAGDPMQMGGYTYAGDNPVTTADPSGLIPVCLANCDPHPSGGGHSGSGNHGGGSSNNGGGSTGYGSSGGTVPASAVLPAAALPAYRQFLAIFHANNPYASGPNAELLSMKTFCDQNQSTMAECGHTLSSQLLIDSLALAAVATGVESIPGAIAEGGEDETGGNSGEEAKIQDTSATDLSDLAQTEGSSARFVTGPDGITTDTTTTRFTADANGSITDRLDGQTPNAVSLGRFPTYVDYASITGARAFNVGDAWGDMAARSDSFGGTGPGSEIWIRNTRFLDQGVANGSDMIPTANPADPANDGSFFMREMNYLYPPGR